VPGTRVQDSSLESRTAGKGDEGKALRSGFIMIVSHNQVIRFSLRTPGTAHCTQHQDQGPVQYMNVELES
jgi:hypothetical protein